MEELYQLQDKNTMYKSAFVGKLNRINQVINSLGVKSEVVHPNGPEYDFHFSADAIFKVSEFNDLVFRFALHDDKYEIVAKQTIGQRNGNKEYFFAINFVY